VATLNLARTDGQSRGRNAFVILRWERTPFIPRRAHRFYARASLHCRGTHSDSYLDARPEPVDDRHKAIDRETVQGCVADAREVGRGDAGTAMRGADSQAFTVERLDDFGCQDGLELIGVRGLVTQITETFPLPRATSSSSFFIATSPSAFLNGRNHIAPQFADPGPRRPAASAAALYSHRPVEDRPLAAAKSACAAPDICKDRARELRTRLREIQSGFPVTHVFLLDG